MPPESPVKCEFLPMEEGDHSISANNSVMGRQETATELINANTTNTYTTLSIDPNTEHELDTAQTVLFVDPVSPGFGSWLGAEVQVENKISRRCSYEEMVHEDFEEVPVPNSATGSSSPDTDNSWYNGIIRVTQWAIVLQEVTDERKNLNSISSKCLCHKAATIVQKLQNLSQLLIQDNQDLSAQQDDLILCVDDVQSALRAGVSIQVSKPNEAVISKASSVVDAALISCEKVAYVKSVIDSIVKLVNDLLHVPTCGHANNGNLLDDTDRIRDISPTRLMEQDEEEDIRSRVASMFHEDEDSEDEDDLESGLDSPRSARKRKQIKQSKNNLTSPTSSPSKRARKIPSTPPGIFAENSMMTCSSAPAKICQTSPALDLLESKKKVQRNSLYHWVLWREALRGEKDRVTHPKRLSFN